MTGIEFEKCCGNLLKKNGFENIKYTSVTGDQGADIIAEKDNIKYAIQCKYYSSTVGNSCVQEITAGKQFYNCHVGLVMTNSTFTSSARELALSNNIILWDGTKLQSLGYISDEFFAYDNLVKVDNISIFNDDVNVGECITISSKTGDLLFGDMIHSYDSRQKIMVFDGEDEDHFSFHLIYKEATKYHRNIEKYTVTNNDYKLKDFLLLKQCMKYISSTAFEENINHFISLDNYNTDMFERVVHKLFSNHVIKPIEFNALYEENSVFDESSYEQYKAKIKVCIRNTNYIGRLQDLPITDYHIKTNDDSVAILVKVFDENDNNISGHYIPTSYMNDISICVTEKLLRFGDSSDYQLFHIEDDEMAEIIFTYFGVLHAIFVTHADILDF